MITNVNDWKRLRHNEATNEKIAGDKNFTTYEIKCKDLEGTLKSLIEYIAELGNRGHGFSIVVDKGDEYEKEFYWDGDGGDRIDSVEITHKPVKESAEYDQLNAEVNALMTRLESTYGVDLWIGASKFKNALTISKIVLPKEERGQGKGTSVMEEICKFADDRSLSIVLTPSKDFGGSVTRLKEFYKNFGFVKYKGYDFRETMIRKSLNESVDSNSAEIMLSLEQGEEPKKLNGKDWEVVKIIDIIQDPKDVEKYEAFAGISTETTYKTVATGDVLWLTALLKPRNRNTTTQAGEMGVIKVKVMNVYYGLNKLDTLRKQGKL